MDESQYHEEMQALREELEARRESLQVIEGEGGKVRRVTNSEVLRILLDRLTHTATPANNTVTITRNAKHEYQFSVDARGETVDEAVAEATRAAEALALVFPPASAAPVRKAPKAGSGGGTE